MADQKITRREFIKESAMTAAAISAGLILSPGQVNAQIDTAQILNYNPDMEYRRCGRTDLMISAAALVGHWKRVV